MKKIFLALCGVFFLLGLNACKPKESPSDITVFTQTGCPHCEHAMAFMNETVRANWPQLTIAEYNIRTSRENYDLFISYLHRYKIDLSTAGTPLIIAHKTALVGWNKETQQQLISLLENQTKGEKK